MRSFSPLLLAIVVAGGALLLALGQTVRLTRLRRRPGRLLRARAERGARGEVAAEALLVRRGYRIEGRQLAGSWRFAVDGEPVDAAVRADLVAVRGGRRFACEVKTGERAPLPTAPATRRQLLEYRHAAFAGAAVDGVLLVDAEKERVVEVRFPPPPGAAPSSTGALVAWLLGVAMGALATGALALLGHAPRP